MKKITIIGVLVLMVLISCKKEADVVFEEEKTTEESKEVVGTKWGQVDADFDEYVEDMIVFDGKIILSYLDFVDGSISFSGEYNGSSFNKHSLQQSGTGFDKFKILNSKLYGMGAVGFNGAWEFDPEAFTKWTGFSSNGTNYYDIDYLDGSLVIASSKSPYIHKGSEAMGEGFNGSINNLLYFNGDLIAVGGFSASGSEEMYGVARWDGSKWQKLGEGLDGSVLTAAIYDGKLVVGGRFKYAGDIECNNIAAWDGTTWSSLNGGFQDEFNAVFSIITAGSELLVGGEFEEADGVYSPYLIKWTGSDWEKLPSGIPSRVGAMTIYKDKLYVVNGTNLENNYFLRLD